MLGIVQDRVDRGNKPLGVSRVVARIRVSVKAREIAAADFKPQAMSSAKNVGGGPEVYRELVNLTRLQRLRRFLGVAIPSANYAFGQIVRQAIGANVYQFGGEIGIRCGRFREQLQLHRPRDFKIVGQRESRIDKNILPCLNCFLIARSGLKVRGVAT